MAFYHVTSAGALAKDGSDWANAMGQEEFETSVEGGGAQAAVAGDTYWVKEGTYTMNSSIGVATVDGTAAEPISIIGVVDATTETGANVPYSRWATGDARPFFDGGTSYGLSFGDYMIIRNIRVESGITALGCITGCIVENVKANCDRGSSGAYYAIQVGSNSAVINCEGTSANCNGLATSSTGVRMLFNWAHDCVADTYAGIYTASNSGLFAFNICDSDCIGMSVGGSDGLTIFNNTIYGDHDNNAGTVIGISATDSFSSVFINNTISECDDGFIWTTQQDINFFWNNNLYGNTDNYDLVDETGQYSDYAEKNVDPEFTTAGSNYSLQATSDLIDAGMAITLGVT